MSMTLNLVECLAAQGRKYRQLGLDHQAGRAWQRLAGLRDLPPKVARETQTSLAEIHLRRQKYSRARRHLTAALAQQPGNAHYHFLLATAIEADDRGDRYKALSHYRRAIELDSQNPEYLCGFGLLALELEQTEEGLSALRQAMELAPDDPEVVGKVVEGLEQDNLDEAQSILRSALFRNSRDGRFRKLWSDFHFHQLRAEQQQGRRCHAQERPTLLPFVQPEASGDSANAGSKKVRRDPPSRPARPHFHSTLSGKKHA